jgi:deoxyribonuclease-4
MNEFTEPAIINIKWDVGAHISFSKTIEDTLINSISRGMYSCQFFMGNPKSFKRQTISNDDIIRSKKLLKHFPTNVFSHYPYIANLNGSKASLAWNGDEEQDMKTLFNIKNLEYELGVLSNFKNNGVVIHPGCYEERTVGLNTISKTINMINFADNSKLLLENCAGEGDKLCKDFSELSTILQEIDSSKRDNVGICVDTAHIWGQGDYDLRSCSEIDRMFYDFDRKIGLDKFSLLHLNDSEVRIGEKKDRHGNIGTGFIWEENTDSLIYLLNKCEENHIPMILETTADDMGTLNNVEIKYRNN